jgi:hypothetical protein
LQEYLQRKRAERSVRRRQHDEEFVGWKLKPQPNIVHEQVKTRAMKRLSNAELRDGRLSRMMESRPPIFFRPLAGKAWFLFDRLSSSSADVPLTLAAGIFQ